MKLLEKIKSWPDEKKKVFSLITAIAATVIIVGTWISFRPSIDTNVPVSNLADKKDINSLKDSFQKISESFNAIKGQLFGTTTNSTSTATTSESTTTNSTTTNN